LRMGHWGTKIILFFWRSRGINETRQHGVDFAVKNNLRSSIESPVRGSERLLAMRMLTSCDDVTLITAYAPTLTSAEDAKDKFYQELDNAVNAIPKSDCIYILDLNARVGSDSDSWPIFLGKFNIGRMNENGQRLLEFCTRNDLCITNSFFATTVSESYMQTL
jgi:hypothetical protein